MQGESPCSSAVPLEAQGWPQASQQRGTRVSSGSRRDPQVPRPLGCGQSSHFSSLGSGPLGDGWPRPSTLGSAPGLTHRSRDRRLGPAGPHARPWATDLPRRLQTGPPGQARLGSAAGPVPLPRGPCLCPGGRQVSRRRTRSGPQGHPGPRGRVSPGQGPGARRRPRGRRGGRRGLPALELPESAVHLLLRRTCGHRGAA